MKHKRASEIQSTRRIANEKGRFLAIFASSEMPESYAKILVQFIHRIRQERLRVAITANTSMTLLYWDLGKIILERQKKEGWGAKVIDRLSHDLRKAFPDMRGLSPRNLKYMRAFAAAWPDRKIVQAPLAQITWYNNIALLEQLDDPQTRLWYGHMALSNGWSQNILTLQIESEAHKRQGKAQHNFPATLPPADSDMAAHIFKDPYLFDFLGTADPRRERDVERALIDHIQNFLIELGTGFAFLGRQVNLQIGNKDYYLDLLFYHVKLRCYIVIELKATPFDPAFVGQLNLYLSAVDDLMRHEQDKPTIGLLLCKSKDKIVVEYALRDLKYRLA